MPPNLQPCNIYRTCHSHSSGRVRLVLDIVELQDLSQWTRLHNRRIVQTREVARQDCLDHGCIVYLPDGWRKSVGGVGLLLVLSVESCDKDTALRGHIAIALGER